MSNVKSTKYISKLQIGDTTGGDDTFLLRVQGEGGLGWPVMDEATRDTIWPVADFPNLIWRGATIYNSTINRVQFNTGSDWATFDTGLPPTSIAAFYQQYASDADYIVAQGSPTDGSVYYNTSLKAVRVYSNGNWYNDLTPEPWANSTPYIVGQIVWDSNNQIFRCVTNHTSSASPATIQDDIINWVHMGAHNIGELEDVDVTGAVENDVLVLNALGMWVAEAKGTFNTPLTIPVVVAEPTTPPAGFVRLWCDGKTIKAKFETGEVVEMLRQYNVVDFLDLGIIDASNIDNTAVSYYTVVASLAADVKAVQIFDTAGINLGWYDGANNLLFVSGPGTNETTAVEIASGTEIKVRPLAASASAFSGNYTVNFLG